ncbi:MAG TPA: EamA family transporter [Actinomycetota bacterium]|nr:EamA family transporter [Actinomycetota bacterium]
MAASPLARRRVFAALGVVYVVWGSTYLAIRVMVRTVPPLVGAGTRFLLAGAILAALVLVRSPATFRGVTGRQARNAATTGLLILMGGIGLVTVAEQHVDSAMAALVIASIPLWIVVLRRLHDERIERRTIGAVAVGFAGLVILLRPGAPGAGVASLVALVSAAVLTAIGSFYSKRMEMPADVSVATVIEMAAAGAGLVVAGIAAGELTGFSSSDVSAESLLSFVYLVTVGSVVAYSAFVWLLANAKVSTVATYAYVNPVVAVVLGVAILDEDVSPSMAAGALAIVLSVVMIVRSEEAERAG